jgi:hypothetical protein
MKTIITAAFAAALLAAGSLTASAQGTGGAYCATMKADQNAAKMNCSYATMAACEEAVKGGKGTCSKNEKMMKK